MGEEGFTETGGGRGGVHWDWGWERRGSLRLGEGEEGFTETGGGRGGARRSVSLLQRVLMTGLDRTLQDKTLQVRAVS